MSDKTGQAARATQTAVNLHRLIQHCCIERALSPLQGQFYRVYLIQTKQRNYDSEKPQSTPPITSKAESVSCGEACLRGVRHGYLRYLDLVFTADLLGEPWPKSWNPDRLAIRGPIR
jgi:hypothetical protein